MSSEKRRTKHWCATSYRRMLYRGNIEALDEAAGSRLRQTTMLLPEQEPGLEGYEKNSRAAAIFSDLHSSRGSGRRR